jgi:hypothetical protein
LIQSTIVRDQSAVAVNLAVRSAMTHAGGLPPVETPGTSGSLPAVAERADACEAATIVTRPITAKS